MISFDDQFVRILNLIKDGTIDKMTIGNITAYKVKDIIRIDIKTGK